MWKTSGEKTTKCFLKTTEFLLNTDRHMLTWIYQSKEAPNCFKNHANSWCPDLFLYIYFIYIYICYIYMFLYIVWYLDMLSIFLHYFLILKMFVLLIFSMNCFLWFLLDTSKPLCMKWNTQNHSKNFTKLNKFSSFLLRKCWPMLRYLVYKFYILPNCF